jgi:hypothetical protein
MSYKLNLISAFGTALIAGALLSCPCAMLAQRGPGSTGGGSAGGGGLSGGGRATGLSVKDDLKDYHLALAVQANSQQVAAYQLMIKTTDAADAELRAFMQPAAKQSSKETGSGSAEETAALYQAIETAHTANKKFMEELSPQQKSGLKEITKQMTKADSELTQQIKVFDLEIRDTKLMAPSVAASAQRVATALATFRARELDLGEEMSIGTSNGGMESFDIPAVRNSLKIGDQSITVTTSGVISKNPEEPGKNIFSVQLTSDLSDLQRNMTDVLRSKLDKSETCGERISTHSATLTPRLQQSTAVLQLHYERWSCRGRDNVSEIVDGNGTIEVKLTPSVGNTAQLQLAAEIGRVDAAGLLGDMLRSGSLGEALRDQLTEVVLSALREGVNFKELLPSTARQSATLQAAHFQSTGSGRLFLAMEGTFQLSNDEVNALTTELKGRATSAQTAPR